MGNVNLSGLNFENADFSPTTELDRYYKGYHLEDRWSKLPSVNFSGANLENVNFQKAFMKKANLSQSNLTNANLIDTILQNADLRGANLSGANLKGADLKGAKLDNIVLCKTTMPWGEENSGCKAPQ